jgi:hypothetical protein
VSQDLISKKDLLDLTGISYGQLYRWKRKNLIPEDWFVRKSTFTGQETFFPKNKILERIDKIQTMKENLSLDDLATMFSPNVNELSLGHEDLLLKGVASTQVLTFYFENAIDKDIKSALNFDQILYVFILELMLQSGNIQWDEAKMVLEVIETHYPTLKQKDNLLLFTRKLGVSSCLFVSNAEDLFFDQGTKIIMKLSTLKLVEELKTKLL